MHCKGAHSILVCHFSAILHFLLVLATTSFAQTWNSLNAPEGGSTIACSADGSRILVNPDVESMDGGQTWVDTWSNTYAPTHYWSSVASSASGMTCFAAVYLDIFGSTNGGQSWSSVLFGTNSGFRQMGCSANGRLLAAATYEGLVFLSTNSGLTFSAVSVPSNSMGSIDVAADGAILGTGPYYDLDANGFLCPIYRSTDEGATWLPVSQEEEQWNAVILSADGMTILGLSRDQTVISHDAGGSWFTNTSLPGTSFRACSADGTRIVTGEWHGGVTFLSLDGGRTWETNPPPDVPGAYAMSADGSVIYAAGYQIYKLTIPAQPSLRLAPKNGSLLLSWPLPSTGFVLQQSASLSGPGWQPMTNAVVATNYWNEVTIPLPTNGAVFYRLVKP